MRLSILTPVVLLVSLALLASSGCKSECHKLCVKQSKCSSASADSGGEGLGHDARIELCKTTCEAMSKDPKRQDAMKRVRACSESGCDDFSACVKKAGAATESPESSQ